MTNAKNCTKCHQEKSYSGFYKDKQHKDGYFNVCKECRKQQDKRWKQRNQQHRKEYEKQYRQSNPEKEKEKQKRYRNNNLEKVKKYNKKWYQNNKEYNKERFKEWYQKNREHNKKRLKEWRQNNKEHRRKQRKIWARNNPEKIRESKKIYNHKRRAMKNKLNQHFTNEEFYRLCQAYNFICLCCETQLSFKELTVDHIIPLCKYGTNTISNIQPLCIDCNSFKGVNTKDFRIKFSQQVTSF